jgi:glycosyltransferase involved in cell wall biosynthesis
MFSAFLAGLIKSRGARLINWIQDLYPEIATAAGVPMASRLPAAPLRMLRNRSLRMATATVVVGDRMAERVRSMGVTDPNSIHVIHNWADGDQIVPMPKHVNALRAQWGLEDRFVVGYSGNLGVVHEAKTILDAIRLMQSHKKIVFLFIGGGSGMRALRHSVEHEALPNVRFLPYQERAALSESLGVPDVHLCSLRPEFEGLVVPSKIFGIMAAARPCIFVGEPDGEVSRLLRRGTAGVTVDAGDAHRLADEILRLFSDSGLAEGLGSAARAYFNNNFDRPIALSKWQKLLAHYG